MGDEAISEFEDMQTYMWVIVVNNVNTATRKQLICEHDGDAEMVYQTTLGTQRIPKGRF